VFDELSAALDGALSEGDTTSSKLAGLLSTVDALRKKIESTAPGEDAQAIRRLEEQRRNAEEQIANLRQEFASQNSNFRNQILALEEKRTRELRELYSRLELLASTRDSRERAFLSPGEEEKAALSKTAYSDLTRPPSLFEKFRMGGTRFALSVVSMLIGVFGSLFSRTLISSFPLMEHLYNQYVAIATILSMLFVLTGAWLMWQVLSDVDTYFDSSARLLRELFVRDAGSETIIRADNILRRELHAYGPKRAMYSAERAIAEEFPYLKERPLSRVT
jgi:hypothetical protein